jgi:hypothetical protein
MPVGSRAGLGMLRDYFHYFRHLAKSVATTQPHTVAVPTPSRSMTDKNKLVVTFGDGYVAARTG